MIPYIDYSKCAGCGACAELYPLFFIMRDEKAWVINHDKFVPDEHEKIAYSCPFGAITIE
jgi:ferredoxin